MIMFLCRVVFEKRLNCEISKNGHSELSRSQLNPHAPIAQKIANEVVFRRFPGEGVEFL